ncbi:MAG: TIGR02117 family protein [Bacteroidota bacterium]
MKTIKKAARLIGRTVLIFLECFFGLLIAFWCCAIILSRIGVAPEGSHHSIGERTTVYITSSGIHTDIVVPLKNKYINWPHELGLNDSLLTDSVYTHLAIGWGDKGFFLETEDWADLKLSVALKATFHLGSSAMHLVQRQEPNTSEKQTVRLSLSPKQYKAFIAFVKGSFSKHNGEYEPIPKHTYGSRHYFFEANRSYGLTYTCNSWANSALKSCGQRACVWTAFKDGIYLQYEK